tara:strand:- start:1797 stop:2432 length:636 start_codon:yes stop_codon:yes gene_type:complete
MALVDLGVGSDSPITFMVSFDKGKLTRILKKFRAEAVKVIGREIKKIMQEERRKTKNRLKTMGVSGSAPQKIADSLMVFGPEEHGEDIVVQFGSSNDGRTFDGVKGSRGGKIAELYEEGRPRYNYEFKGGGKGTAHKEGRPIVPSKMRGFGGAGSSLSNYLPPGLQTHAGYPKLAWNATTRENTERKLVSNRIPDALARAFGEHFNDRRFK